LVRDPPSVFRRSLAAALARAVEGLVRAEVCDVVDALLFVAKRLTDPEHFKMLAEASKNPDLIAMLERYEIFVRADVAVGTADSADVAPLSLPGFSDRPLARNDDTTRKLEALSAFAEGVSVERSNREEALRMVLVRLARALSRIRECTSLSELSSSEGAIDSPLTALEGAVGDLAQLSSAALLRLVHDEQDEVRSIPGRHQIGALRQAIERSLAGESVDLKQAIDQLGVGLVQALPVPIAGVALAVLADVPTLPRTARRIASSAQVENPLPSWLPPRRTLGGFYVLRSLGAGDHHGMSVDHEDLRHSHG